jgi:GNAT superfamily N-acetyltransferase
MVMTLDPDVAYWCEMAEAYAWGDLFTAAAEQPGNPTRAHVETPGDGVAFALQIVDIFLSNRVLGLGIARPAIESDVEAAVGFFDRLGCGVTAAPLSPHATPPELRTWFEARGYAPSRNWVKLWHGLQDLPSVTTDLRIEVVGPEWADDFARISVIEAYGFPPEIAPCASATMGRVGWRHYLGFDGDTPVSAAAMRIQDGVAWLGFGATTEGYRRRGGQSAMFARRLRDARDAGCRLAMTETGEETPDDPNPSYHNMLRAGFELAYARRNWIRRVGDAPS